MAQQGGGPNTVASANVVFTGDASGVKQAANEAKAAIAGVEAKAASAKSKAGADKPSAAMREADKAWDRVVQQQKEQAQAVAQTTTSWYGYAAAVGAAVTAIFAAFKAGTHLGEWVVDQKKRLQELSEAQERYNQTLAQFQQIRSKDVLNKALTLNPEASGEELALERLARAEEILRRRQKEQEDADASGLSQVLRGPLFAAAGMAGIPINAGVINAQRRQAAIDAAEAERAAASEQVGEIHRRNRAEVTAARTEQGLPNTREGNRILRQIYEQLLRNYEQVNVNARAPHITLPNPAGRR